MMPIRTSMVGPPRTARSNACIAVCHSIAVCSAFGSFAMYSPASLRVTSSRLFPRGPRGGTIMGSSNLWDHPDFVLGATSGEIVFRTQPFRELNSCARRIARAVRHECRLPIGVRSRFEAVVYRYAQDMAPVGMLPHFLQDHRFEFVGTFLDFHRALQPLGQRAISSRR